MSVSWSKRLMTHNPFYLISVVLVLYGLNALFGPTEGAVNNPWFMIGSLVGYICLMAGAGILIIRKAHAWDDARMLLILMMFVLIASTSFLEDILWQDLNGGRIAATGLIIFSIIIIETINRAIHLGLSLYERILIHGWITLFAATPVFIVDLAQDGSPSAYHRMGQYLLAFPLMAAGLFILAIWTGRPGKRYGRSPWAWPVCPLSLYFLLAVGVGFRARWLTMSNYAVGNDQSAFGSWLITPLIVAVAIVGMVIAMRFGRRRLAIIFELLPLVALLTLFDLPLSTRSNEAKLFDIVELYFGNPALCLTLVCLGIYAIGSLRKYILSPYLLVGTLVTISIQVLQYDIGWHYAVISLLLTMLLWSLYRNTIFPTALATVFTSVYLAGSLANEFLPSIYVAFWAFNILTLTILVSALFFETIFSRFVRIFTVLSITFGYAGELIWPTNIIAFPVWNWECYVAGIPLIFLLIDKLFDEIETRILAILITSFLLIRYTIVGIIWIMNLNIPDGLLTTLSGLGALLLGVWVSLRRKPGKAYS